MNNRQNPPNNSSLLRDLIDNRFGLLAALAISVAFLISASCVGMVLLITDRQETGAPATETNVKGDINGSCSANGINNTIDCKPLGPSMASVTVVESADQLGWLWFDGPPEELPRVPAEFAGSNSCRDPGFMAWVRSEERIYLTGIEKDVIEAFRVTARVLTVAARLSGMDTPEPSEVQRKSAEPR